MAAAEGAAEAGRWLRCGACAVTFWVRVVGLWSRAKGWRRLRNKEAGRPRRGEVGSCSSRHAEAIAVAPPPPLLSNSAVFLLDCLDFHLAGICTSTDQPAADAPTAAALPEIKGGWRRPPSGHITSHRLCQRLAQCNGRHPELRVPAGKHLPLRVEGTMLQGEQEGVFANLRRRHEEAQGAGGSGGKVWGVGVRAPQRVMQAAANAPITLRGCRGLNASREGGLREARA